MELIIFFGRRLSFHCDFYFIYWQLKKGCFRVCLMRLKEFYWGKKSFRAVALVKTPFKSNIQRKIDLIYDLNHKRFYNFKFHGKRSLKYRFFYVYGTSDLR